MCHDLGIVVSWKNSDLKPKQLDEVPWNTDWLSGGEYPADSWISKFEEIAAQFLLLLPPYSGVAVDPWSHDFIGNMSVFS